jgi:hypothetical protein
MGMAALDALTQRIVVRANVRGIARDERARTRASSEARRL